MTSASSAANTAGHNALVKSLMVCSGFIICFSPYYIVGLVGFYTRNVDVDSWYYHLTVVLMFTNSFINPFIYAAKYREFQQGVRRLASKLNHQQSQVAAIA